MPKSTFLVNGFLNATLRGIAFTSPLGIYVALYTTSPTISGGGVEVSGGSYARQAAVFGAPSGGQCGNMADVTFPIASADWGTIVAYGLFDALTSGNLLYYSVMSSPRTVVTNDQVRFTTGQLVVIES
jgi:hypothetical protein